MSPRNDPADVPLFDADSPAAHPEPTPTGRHRQIGDILDLEIGTAARRKYRITEVTDDHHFTVEPIR